jgi:protein associated with RNAse G/E
MEERAMTSPILYRKRLIPNECILLKDDILLYRDEEILITKWNTIRPKKDLHHGMSCYFLKKGIKVSKFCDAEDNLICWYCDIISHSWDPDTDTYIFTDLLADVLVYPDGFVKVLDLDELADATAEGLLTEVQLEKSLRRTNWLLELIYGGHFEELQRYLAPYESTASAPADKAE